MMKCVISGSVGVVKIILNAISGVQYTSFVLSVARLSKGSVKATD